MLVSIDAVIQRIKRLPSARVGVGVLVEYPLSSPRHTVHGSLLGKWGKKHDAPHDIRKVSVVLLVEDTQSGNDPLTAVPIRWIGWWRVRWWRIIWKRARRFRSAKKRIGGCKLFDSNGQIQICELQDDGQCVGGHISDFYVLDLSGRTPDVLDSMAYAEALREILVNSSLDVEDLDFLATCDDLEWLARRDPKYIPKLVKYKVISLQKNVAEADIDGIENDIINLKFQLELRENDLLEAKDRLNPQRRWLKGFLGKPIIWQLTSFSIGIYAFFVSLFVFIFQVTIFNELLTSSNVNALALAGSIFLVVIFAETYRRNKKASEWAKKIFIKQNFIEESRDRQTEKHFQNL